MPAIEEKIHGYNRLQNKLRRIAADNPEISDIPVRDFSQEMRAVLKAEPYPPKPVGSRYIRTGQLANRWAVKNDGGLGRYSIINHARTKYGYYAGWVVGAEQTRVHKKNKWWKAKAVIRRKMPQLTAQLTEIYRKIWKE